MEPSQKKLKLRPNQLVVYSLDCLLTMDWAAILQLMEVDCSPTPQEAFSLIIQGLDCLLINKQLGCLQIMDPLPVNKKLEDYSVALLQLVAVSSTSNLVSHQSKTLVPLFLDQNQIMIRMILVIALSLKLPKILKLIHQKAQSNTNTNRPADWLWNKKHSNSKKLVVIWSKMLTL